MIGGTHMIEDAICELKDIIKDPQDGLSQEVFNFVSSITALVNVDLLIYNNKKHILLAWRDDLACEPGWHIPGGIIRFKERLEERLQKVAEGELGTRVKYDPIPIAVNEIFAPQDARGHFISFLYQCNLPESFNSIIDFDPYEHGLKLGMLRWHRSCPDNLIQGQLEVYHKYFLK